MTNLKVANHFRSLAESNKSAPRVTYEPTMSYSFAGKRALVTGAGKGEMIWSICIGLAMT